MTQLSYTQRMAELSKATKDAKKAASKANQTRLAKLSESTREARWSPVMVQAMDKWESALKSGDMAGAARYNAVAMRINRMITGGKKSSDATRTNERGFVTIAYQGERFGAFHNKLDAINAIRHAESAKKGVTCSDWTSVAFGREFARFQSLGYSYAIH